MYTILNFLSRLIYAKPASHINLTDSHDTLTKRIYTFAGAWQEQATFPPTLRPRCSSLLEKVASGASELDAWAAVAHLIIEFSSLRVPAAPTPEESDITNDEMESSILYKLREKWTSEYLPESLHALQDTIRETRAKWIGNNHFTPRL